MTRNPAGWPSLTALVLTIAACGQPFFTPRSQLTPSLSNQPVDSTEPLTRGVLQAVLKESNAGLLFDGLVAPHLADPPKIGTTRSDSTRRAFEEALNALRNAPLGPVDSLVVAGLNVKLTDEHLSSAISPVGYDRDSTHAVIYYQVHCGMRCGHGALLFLARRRGYAWTVFASELLWIS